MLLKLTETTAAPPCAGPIARLDFVQSLDPARFAEAAEQEALVYARLHLSHLVDAASITLQTLRQWGSHSEMLVGASAEVAKAMRTGAAVFQQHGPSGRLLPHVMNRATGQAMEVMKEVGVGRKVIAGAAAASTIVVSAAHMIATADLARTLTRVDQKVDLLIAFRQIDQDAELERIYAAARELLAAPLDELRRMEVWRLRGDLRALRATWRRELEHHLAQIENPAEEGWLDRMFTSQSSYDKRISGKISDGTLQLMMVEYSLRLDRVLAAASDTWDVSKITLADELAAIDGAGALLKEKAGFLSETRRVSAQPMIEGIAAIVLHYRRLLQAHPDVMGSAVADVEPVALIEAG